LIDNNYKELFVPDSKCTQVADDTDKINIPITNNKSDTNEDSLDDDDSAYTMADSFDPDKQTFIEKSKEPIRPGDVINYYCPIFESGEPHGLRENSVLAVVPNDKFPLVVSNGDGLPSTTQVKHIKVYRNNILMDHCGLFCEIGRFILKKRGSATAADGGSMQE
jgi:hypothetical protein